MALSTVTKHFTDGSITLKDGTGTPLTLTVALSVGDLTISGLETDTLGRAVNAYETRGVLRSLRRGARVYPTVSFSAHLADVTDATGRPERSSRSVVMAVMSPRVAEANSIWQPVSSSSGTCHAQPRDGSA